MVQGGLDLLQGSSYIIHCVRNYQMSHQPLRYVFYVI